MKKHLIAAAVAGALAVPAMAQVSISGRLDAGYTSVDAEGSADDVKGVAYNSDTSSRITFKASEDLGGGLKAGLFLEGQISGQAEEGDLSPDGYDFNSFGRGQYLTLSGGFGQVLVGYANSVGKKTLEGFGSASGGTNSIGTLHEMTEGKDSRNDQITYSTPKISGFNAEVEFRSKEEGSDDKGSGYGVAANYASGALKLRASYDEEAVTPLFDVKRTAAAAAFGLGVVTLHGLYSDIETEGTTATTGEGYEFGVSSKLGAAKVFASIAKTEVTTGAATTETDAYVVGARYSLSKRTYAYLIAGQRDEDGADNKVSQTSVGIVHKF
jgi:predicted porin